METGLTRHEARLYILLTSEGALTGYEAAKLSSMSRSNAYLSLAGLTEKGGCVCIDGDVRRYVAVPVAEFCRNKHDRFRQVIQSIKTKMPEPQAIAEPFLTIKGREHILNKMHHLIRQTRKRIYLSLALDELSLVFEDLLALQGQNRKIVIITSAPFEMEGAIVYHTEKKPGQIRLIVDSEWILTGEIKQSGESSCLFSRHQALVDLFKESMINEMKLITINENNPEKLIEEQTRQEQAHDRHHIS